MFRTLMTAPEHVALSGTPFGVSVELQVMSPVKFRHFELMQLAGAVPSTSATYQLCRR